MRSVIGLRKSKLPNHFRICIAECYGSAELCKYDRIRTTASEFAEKPKYTSIRKSEYSDYPDNHNSVNSCGIGIGNNTV